MLKNAPKSEKKIVKKADFKKYKIINLFYLPKCIKVIIFC